jgi:lantibiotic modifying enzyme
MELSTFLSVFAPFLEGLSSSSITLVIVAYLMRDVFLKILDRTLGRVDTFASIDEVQKFIQHERDVLVSLLSFYHDKNPNSVNEMAKSISHDIKNPTPKVIL